MAEKKFLDFMDRFDGGGMGKSGDKFEGGGLLSLLGNIFAKPYGYEDRAKEEALAGLLGETRPNMRPNRPAPSAASSQGMSLNAGPAMQRMPTDPRLALPGNPSGPINDGLGPMPQRLQGDPSLGFNPANAAPVQPNPFSGGPGFGGDGRSLDGEILRYAPTGLSEVPSQDAAPSELQMRDFVQQIKEKYPNRVNEILRSDSILNIINYYNQTGVLPVIGPTP